MFLKIGKYTQTRETKKYIVNYFETFFYFIAYLPTLGLDLVIKTAYLSASIA